jgi:hypothetical protein
MTPSCELGLLAAADVCAGCRTVIPAGCGAVIDMLTFAVWHLACGAAITAGRQEWPP